MRKLLLVLSLVMLVSAGCCGEKNYRAFEPSGSGGEILKAASATAANLHVASNQYEEPKGKLSAEEVAAVEVTAENSYEAPLNKYPKEKSKSELSSTPSREESPG